MVNLNCGKSQLFVTVVAAVYGGICPLAYGAAQEPHALSAITDSPFIACTPESKASMVDFAFETGGVELVAQTLPLAMIRGQCDVYPPAAVEYIRHVSTRRRMIEVLEIHEVRLNGRTVYVANIWKSVSK